MTSSADRTLVVPAGGPAGSLRLFLLHAPSFDPGPIRTALDAEGLAVRTVDAPDDLTPEERPTALVLDAEARPRFPAAALRRFVDQGGAVVALGGPGEGDVPDTLPADLLSGFVPASAGPRQLLLALRAAFREAAGRLEVRRARAEAARRTEEIGELTRIGIALSAERDLDTLLEMILTQARRITASDGGSLYLVEKTEDRPTHLRFVLAQNDSRPNIPLVEFTMPIDHESIAGHVTLSGVPSVIDDAYVLPDDSAYAFNRSIDERYNYRTKSMLTIPMQDHRDEIIGVVQLINRKRDATAILQTPADVEREVVPYSQRTVELVSALSAQAAVAIENSRLYEAIKRLFEGFVEAAVTAIEQRDPPTRGHSRRVADTSVRLAEAVDRVSAGSLRDVTFTRDQLLELKYAGLLHDFGKVGVREQVLVKAKKLYETDLRLIRQRHAFVHRTAERDFHRRRAEFLEQHGRRGYQRFLAELESAYQAEIERLERFLAAVERANEPTVLPAEAVEELQRYQAMRYTDLAGEERPLLTDEEVGYLRITKGSLNDDERLEIESHVNHTYKFLLQIPWTGELKSVPVIAWGHHEKMDGSGYPRRVTGSQIPVQTRMMTIADIFDALTAQDRPYKPALPVPRALDILHDEVQAGQLDPDLFRVFVEAKAYEHATVQPDA